MHYKRVKLLITHQLYTYIALWDVYNHDNKYVIIVESNKHSTNTVVNIVVHYKYAPTIYNLIKLQTDNLPSVIKVNLRYFLSALVL